MKIVGAGKGGSGKDGGMAHTQIFDELISNLEVVRRAKANGEEVFGLTCDAWIEKAKEVCQLLGIDLMRPDAMGSQFCDILNRFAEIVSGN